MSRWLTKSLFFETSKPEMREEFETCFTLKEDDHEYEGVKYLSLRKIFIECEDPTEYEFAQKVFGSYNHWKAVKATSWFQPYYEDWKEELEVRMRSKALKALIKCAEEDGSRGSNAAKYLAEKGWEKGPVGRRSKDILEKEAKKQIRIVDEIEEDLDRMSAHMH